MTERTTKDDDQKQEAASPEDRADALAAQTEAERRANAPDYKPTP